MKFSVIWQMSFESLGLENEDSSKKLHRIVDLLLLSALQRSH